MDKINRVIATSFLPNMDNVTREFITSALPNILFKDDYPNFNFKFLEPEAIEFIDKVWLRYLKSSNSEYLYNKYKKVINTLKNVDDNPNDLPIMVISDYHRFFINLRKFYKNGIDAYFKRTKFQTFTRIEKDNLLEQIWIRCTPEDFNNPERFLEIQNESIQNELFEDYRNEICLGASLLFKNNILCFKVIESAPYNESTKEINIKLYNKDDYLNNAKFKKYYKLASVRFNIYQDNGKYVCEIGSIQSEKNYSSTNRLNRVVNSVRAKENINIDEEYTKNVEPNKLLSLALFINIINQYGINEIKIPTNFVLDYEYHVKFSEKRKKYIQEYCINNNYDEEKYKEEMGLDTFIDKEDLISELKTERMIYLLQRLLLHYTNGYISSYPGDCDSYLHIKLSNLSIDSIDGPVFKEMYEITKNIKKI